MHGKTKQTTIALEYKYPYGAVNAVWGARQRFNWTPDKIILFTPNPHGELANQTKSMLEAWQRSYLGESQVILQEADHNDFAGIRDDAELLMQEERANGQKVSIDVTSGRTIPKLALYHAALRSEPDHVFYLNVQNYDYRPQPHPMIPLRVQRCQDLSLKEVMERGN